MESYVICDTDVVIDFFSEKGIAAKILIGNQDICIAATCIARKLPLLTRNIEHFSRIQSLKLLDPLVKSKN